MKKREEREISPWCAAWRLSGVKLTLDLISDQSHCLLRDGHGLLSHFACYSTMLLVYSHCLPFTFAACFRSPSRSHLLLPGGRPCFSAPASPALRFIIALRYDISGREKGIKTPQGVAVAPAGVTPDSPAPVTYLVGCGYSHACSRFLSDLSVPRAGVGRLYAHHTRDEDCLAAFRDRDTGRPLPSTIPTCKPEWRGVFGHSLSVHSLGGKTSLGPGHCTCRGIPGHFIPHTVLLFSPAAYASQRRWG